MDYKLKQKTQFKSRKMSIVVLSSSRNEWLVGGWMKKGKSFLLFCPFLNVISVSPSTLSCAVLYLSIAKTAQIISKDRRKSETKAKKKEIEEKVFQ